MKLLTVISPAKTLYASGMVRQLSTPPTVPRFVDEADTLVSHLKCLKSSDFVRLMSVSSNIADVCKENYDDYTRASEYAAIDTKARNLKWIQAGGCLFLFTFLYS